MNAVGCNTLWFGLACCVTVVPLLWLPGCSRSARNRSDVSPLTDEDVVRLLQREIDDEPIWDVRGNTPDWFGVRGNALWERLHPVSFSDERVIALGSAAVDPLIRVVTTNAGPRVASEAIWVLAYFDDPRILRTCYEAARRDRVKSTDLQSALDIHLPVGPLTLGAKNDEVLKWLEERVDEDYADLRLALLDWVMTNEHIERGRVVDLRVIRWLNRIYDYDLDEWLARVAPRALAFRNAELEKGYDPLVLERLAGNLENGNLDEGIKAVYSDRHAQAACHELFVAVYGLSLARSPLHSLYREGWQYRLIAWYREHRDQLVYDFEKHRFVVEGPPATQAWSEGGRE